MSSDPLRSGARSVPSLVEGAAVVVGFTLLTIAMTWPVAPRMWTDLPGDASDPQLNAWIISWGADRLRVGLDGWWHAPIAHPDRFTLAYSEHLLGIALLVAPAYWLTGNPVFTYNCAFLLAYVLAGSAMYLLARSLTGRRDAALVAGLIFAFAPFRRVQTSHVQVLMSGWMPLMVWALHRYFASGSRKMLAVCTGAFILQGLSNTYFLFFAVVPVVVIGLFELISRRPAWKRTLADAALAAAVIGAVFLPIARGYAGAGLAGGEGGRGAAVGVGNDVLSYFRVPPIFLAWRWLPVDSPAMFANDPESLVFPGLTAVVLGLVGVLSRPADRDRRVRIAAYVATAWVAFVVSLGERPTIGGLDLPVGGVYRLIKATVPGFAVIRAPERLMVVFLLALAVLAAFGVARLVTRLDPRRRVPVVAGLCLLVLAEGWSGALPTARADYAYRPTPRAAYEWLRASPPGAAIELPIEPLVLRRVQLRFQVATLIHGHPTINGGPRFRSALSTFLVGRRSPLADPAELEHIGPILRAAGVRYVTVHHDFFASRELAAASVAALAKDLESVAEHRTFGRGRGRIDAFRLLDWPPAPDDSTWRPIPATAFAATASTGADRLPLALDGDAATGWYARRQTGTETIDLDFGAGTFDVARVRLVLSRSTLSEYPRRLVVESTDPAGAVAVVYDGSVLAQLTRGLTDPSGGYAMDVDLPANRSRRLRLHQAGRSDSGWTIRELALWAR